MFLREIVQALERLEQNQEKILGRMAALENKSVNAGKTPDEWMQQGIDSIMNYQAGKKGEKQG